MNFCMNSSEYRYETSCVDLESFVRWGPSSEKFVFVRFVFSSEARLRQSADDIFRCMFLGVLRVKTNIIGKLCSAFFRHFVNLGSSLPHSQLYNEYYFFTEIHVYRQMDEVIDHITNVRFLAQELIHNQ